MSQLNVSSWGHRQRGLPLYSIVPLVIAGMLSVVQLGRAGTPSFTLESTVVVARWRGALLRDAQLSFPDTLESALQNLGCFECASSYAKPVAALIIALAAALLVFGMHSSVATRADR